MLTARQIADRVRDSRQKAWDASNPSAAIVASEKLGDDDLNAVRKAVAAEGYTGEDAAEMVKRVAAFMVGNVQAMADDMPATGGD
jgi:hypothetical protein